MLDEHLVFACRRRVCGAPPPAVDPLDVGRLTIVAMNGTEATVPCGGEGMDESASGTELISAAAFHRAPGVSQWRVTSAGPEVVYRSTTLSAAAALVAPVVAAAERFGILPDVDVRPEAVVVRVPYRDPEGIPAAAPAFAAEVSRAAAELGLAPDPSLAQAVGIYVAEHSAADVRPFFLAALGYAAFGATDAIDPLRRGPQLAFNPISGDVPSRGRTHFDVFVPADQAQARVDAALAAGGRLVDDANAPAWWSLASPDNHGVDIASWTDTYE